MKKRTKKTLSVAGALSLRLLAATVFCGILFISMNMISTAFFSEPVGYQIFEIIDDKKQEPVGEPYYYKDSEKPVDADDLDLSENQELIVLRDVPQSTQRVFDVITQILMLVLLGLFPYNRLWEFGNRDDTNVRYRGQRPDKLRGLKVGLLAIVPFFAIWLCVFITQFIADPGLLGDVYRISHIGWWNIIDWVTLSGTAFTWWRMLILLPTYLFVPAVAAIAYTFGTRQFSIQEFITFKKKKSPDKDA